MAQIDRIREMRQVKGWSINKIAKRLNCSWATVKRYADEPVDLQTRGRRKRTSPVIGPYEHIIDTWLGPRTSDGKRNNAVRRKRFTGTCASLGTRARPVRYGAMCDSERWRCPPRPMSSSFVLSTLLAPLKLISARFTRSSSRYSNALAIWRCVLP